MAKITKIKKNLENKDQFFVVSWQLLLLFSPLYFDWATRQKYVWKTFSVSTVFKKMQTDSKWENNVSVFSGIT